MLRLQKSYLLGDLWYAIFDDNVLIGAWYYEDLPDKYFHLLAKE